MIVWINGAFGVGKTSVARRLVVRWGGAIVVDPELLGVALQRIHGSGDFQDLPAWRRWTVRSLRLLSRARARVVVPMTLVNERYFEDVVGTIRRKHEVRHFALMACRETIVERLRGRGEVPGSWAEAQIDRCLAALPDATFAEHVSTEGRGVDAVVDVLLESLSR